MVLLTVYFPLIELLYFGIMIWLFDQFRPLFCLSYYHVHQFMRFIIKVAFAPLQPEHVFIHPIYVFARIFECLKCTVSGFVLIELGINIKQ